MTPEQYNSNLSQFNDSEVISIKLKIKEVEIEINILENERIDIEKLIHEFEIRHNNELGEFILEILKIRKERLQEEVRLKDEKQNEFSEAKRDYEDFQNNYDKTINEKVFDLTPDEKESIKIKYRRASKLCHPDIVNDILKEEAELIFRELNIAYERNDLNKVNEILENLEKGIFVSNSDSTTEFENLKEIFKRLIIKRENLFKIINNIKKTDTYQVIDKISDWDKYFFKMKGQLEKELSKLQFNE